MMRQSVCFLTGALLLEAAPAWAASDNALQRQIDALREDMQVMQRQMYRSQGGEAGENITIRVSNMDENLRDLIGRADMLEHQLKTLDEKINMINKDMDVRLKMIEGKPIESGGMSKQAPVKKFDAPVAKDAPASIIGGAIEKGSDLPEVKTKTAEQIYQEGLDAINSGKNDEAAAKFNIVLTKFPDHKLAANAQYWLGESYYGKKDYAKAAVAFAKGYEKYKDSNKGADNILKLGMSMQMLGKTEEACTAFVNLPKEFPKAPDNLKNKAAQLASELKCKQ